MKLLPLALVVMTGRWGRGHREALMCAFAMLEGLAGAALLASHVVKPHAGLARMMLVGADVVFNGPMIATARQVRQS